MPVTTIDTKTALIVVDLQKGIVNLPSLPRISGVIERCCALIDAFRRHGLPVVLVNVAGGAPGRTEQPRRLTTFPEGFTDLLPELNQQPGDILVTKRRVSRHGPRKSTESERRHAGGHRWRGYRNRRRGHRTSGV